MSPMFLGICGQGPHLSHPHIPVAREDTQSDMCTVESGHHLAPGTIVKLMNGF